MTEMKNAWSPPPDDHWQTFAARQQPPRPSLPRRVAGAVDRAVADTPPFVWIALGYGTAIGRFGDPAITDTWEAGVILAVCLAWWVAAIFREARR